MKAKSILAALLLMMAGLQTALAQRMIIYKADKTTIGLGVIEVDSIVFVDDEPVPGICPDDHHPHAIDLGLPSGTKWACCNVGASAPEGYGGYYAWGETSEKSEYNFLSYPYYGYTGYVDIGTDIAGTAYDAATVNMSAAWRMPSHEQQVELIDNCSYQWAEQNGVDGILVTGPSGSHIFLPAAGSIYDDRLDDSGSMGNYWSSMVDPEAGFCAFMMAFDSSEWYWNLYYTRPAGFSVRAVAGESISPAKLVTAIALSDGSLSLEVGETQALTATISPADATNKAVTWTSSNEAVATVSNIGLVTAVAEGSCTVTCSATDGSGVKAECQVTVTSSGGALSVVVAPEGLETEEYVVVARNYKDNDDVSGSVQIGFDGSDVYIQGLSTWLPEAWVKGTLEGTTITFPYGQYLGNYGGNYDMFLNVLMGEDVVFEYDAEAGTLTAQNEFFLVDNSQYYFDSYRGAVLKKVLEKAAMPANPAITSLQNGSYGWYFGFNIPTVDVDGNGLATAKLYYMIYTDVEGEIAPLTFTSATHERLTEDMTEIPYGFTEGWDFYSNTIYLNDLFSDDWNNLGIQSIYYGGGEVNATEVQWYHIKNYSGSDDHEWVEIGGQWWATMNLGATTVAGSYETCFGDYYAWGETEPRYTSMTRTSASEVTFAWKSAYVSDWGSGYCEDYWPSYTGTVLDAAHDAATANWGGNWRTPTHAEYLALAKACSGSGSDEQTPVELTRAITSGGIYWLSAEQEIEPDYTGVAGLLFVDRSDTSKRVFFPACGCILDDGFSGGDEEGYYWSSSFFTWDDYYAYNLYFEPSFVTPSFNLLRYFGFAVRPVHVQDAVAVQPVTGITLNETSLTLKVGETQTLTATIQPSDATNKAVSWTSSNEDVATVSNIGLVTAVAKGTCTVTCSATDGSGVKAECQVTVTGSAPDPENHEWVDLGLPSGTKWATCNVGASSPKEYGYYFAWGETEPKYEYNWGTYKWMNAGQPSWSQINKYTSADGQTGACWYSNGTFIGDGKTELEAADDAATVNWGSGWQMPSIAQLQELFNSSYTTTEWTTLNGISGRKITSKSNGNTIFLPAAGYRSDTLLYSAGPGGLYWSRSLSTNYSYIAYSLDFSSGDIYWDDNGRYYGQSVRPVRKQ